MIRRFISIDTETTGLDPVKSCPIAISGQVGYFEPADKQMVIERVFDLRCCPFEGAEIHSEALEKNGLDLSEVVNWPEPRLALMKLKGTLETFKYKKWDQKPFWIGYNTRFDIAMLEEMFKRDKGNIQLVDLTNFYSIDPFPLTALKIFSQGFTSVADMPNLQLKTVADRQGIYLDAHDALSDSWAALSLVIRELHMEDNIETVVMNGKTYKISDVYQNMGEAWLASGGKITKNV